MNVHLIIYILSKIQHAKIIQAHTVFKTICGKTDPSDQDHIFGDMKRSRYSFTQIKKRKDKLSFSNASYRKLLLGQIDTRTENMRLLLQIYK